MPARARLASLLLIAALVTGCAGTPPAPTPTPAAALPTAAPPAPRPGYTPVPPDQISPVVVQRSPERGEELPPGGAVELVFDRPMDQAAVAGALSLLPVGAAAPLAGTVEWPDARTLRFRPDAPLARGALYDVSLGQGARATDGASLAGPYQFRFATAGFLEVGQTIPANGAADVQAESTITVFFNRPVVPLVGVAQQSGLPSPVSFSPAISGRGEWLSTAIFQFTPDQPLAAGTTYTGRVAAGLADTEGNPLQSEYTWSFAVARPQVLAVDPPDGVANVALQPPVTVTFNRPIDEAGARAAFRLRDASGAEVPGTLTVRQATLTFTPTQRLALDTEHRVEVAANLGAAGALAGDFRSAFRTVPLPRILRTEPADGERNAPPYAEFAIIFNAPIDPATVMPSLQFTPAIDATRVYTSFNTYDNSFRVSFGARPSTDYVVRVGPGITDPYGNPAASDRALPFEVRFRTTSLPPSAQIFAPGPISTLGTGGPTRAAIVSINQPQADLALYRLPVEALNQPIWAVVQGVPGSAQQLRRWQAQLQTRPDEPSLALVDLVEGGGRLDPGLYLLALDQPGGSPQLHLLSVSPLNLTLKSAERGALVWATDLASGRPVAGLAVELFDGNGAPLGSATTDAQGVARARLTRGMETGLIALARQPFAAAGTQWGGGSGPWELGIPIAGDLPETLASVYTDRPIYRPGQEVHFKGVVRGEDDARLSLPSPGKVQVTIYDASGQTIQQQDLDLSASGTFSGSVRLGAGAPTGTYTIGVAAGSGFSFPFQVAAYRPPEIQVAVRPGEREAVRGTQVQVTSEATYFFGGAAAGLPVQWNVLAEPFAFAPEWGGRYTWSAGAAPWRCWDCWLRPAPPPTPILSGRGTTDAQGRFAVPLPAELRDPQGNVITDSVRLTVEATVTGRDNQAISGREAIVVHAGDLYVGLAPRSYLGRAGQPQEVDLATARRDGSRLPSQQVSVEIVKVTWDTRFIAEGGGRWESTERRETVATQSVTTDANGEAVVRFTPADAGSYQVLARAADGGGREARSALYVWVAGDGYTPWLRENNDRVSVIADKTTYSVGETATVLVPSPFQGPHWALFTVERGGVLSHEVREVSGNSLVYQVPITADHVPNIYVTVTLVSPASQGQPADYRVGYLPLAVPPEQQTLDVTVTPGAAQAGPGEPATFEVLVRDAAGRPVAAELSLDLVDKAVLSLQPRTPDALREALYARRPLGVTTASGLALSSDRFLRQFEDLLRQQQQQQGGGGQVEAVFDEVSPGLGGAAGAPAATTSPAAAEAPAAPMERAGGDKAASAPGVTVREQFADTAYWSPVVTTDASGRASVQIDLPDNLTTWVMRGVALSGPAQVGEGTGEIVATKPLLLRPVAPRFFTVGDTAEVAANVTNATSGTLDVQVSLATTGLTVTSPLTQTVAVPAGGEAQVSWQVAAQDVEGADMVFTATAGQLSDAARPRIATGPNGTVAVLRYSVPEVVGTGGQLEAAGARTEVVGLPPRLDARSGELTVRLDPSLAAGIRDALTALESSSYESTEGIVSRFVPNVAAARALRQLGVPNAELEAKLPALVEDSLARLYAQQKGDGGWGWWAEDESNPYTSAYVVFGMLKAREAGFAVREDILAFGMDYLAAQLQPAGRAVTDWTTYEADRDAWLLYVLAEGGRLDDARLTSLYAAREHLGVAARSFLALAIHRQSAADERLKTLLSDLNNAAIASATGAHWEEQARGWWGFGSDTRTTAVALATLVRLDPQNQLTPNVVRWLMVARQLGVWETSQESAWAVIALTDWMARTGELRGEYDYALWLNGAERAAGRVTPAEIGTPIEVTVPIAELARDQGNPLQVGRGDGPGRLYYTAHLRAFLPVEDVQALDRGFSVSRRYVLASCTDGPRCPEVREVRLGDVVRVELSVTTASDRYYVRVEDGLPAGFEAVDPTLATTSRVAREPGIVPGATGEGAGARGGLWWDWWWPWYSRSELRDEEVVLFADFLPRGSYLYSYEVRATLPGEFRAIPAVATESYFPEVYGRSDGALLRVGR